MSTVDDYLNTITPPQKAEYERIRNIVKQIIPEAEEVISYAIPAFRYSRRNVIYVGAFKNHMSIFPGTVKFTPEKPLTEEKIKELVTNRLKSISKNSSS